MTLSVNIEQGSDHWLELRKSKITATDAPIIMGVSKWKTPLQLYKEKKDPSFTTQMNEQMKRGVELEPIARSLFTLKTGIKVEPAVFLKDWAMASLDGIDCDKKTVVEIKCPGAINHEKACQGKVPEHYIPQLQHQMHVCEVDEMFYFSFDGFDGVIVKVYRDNSLIKSMLKEEEKFYECLMNSIPPEPKENDYIERYDEEWLKYALSYKYVKESMKDLENRELILRKKLLELSGESNSKGGGISLCKMTRKGKVDYSKIPGIDEMDLDQYREKDSTFFKINIS